MTGAIVGDLAAWTWLNDHDAFYPRLISDKAKTSASSETIFTASNALLGNPEIEREKYEQLFRPKVGEERCYDTLMRAIVIGWLYEEHQLSDNVQKYSLHEEKEDWYAAHFLAKLICALRNGATKKAAAQVAHIDTFRSFTKQDHWKTGCGTLSMLVRAWMAFYDAFDFTSALHNAMKLPGDKYVNGILVGSLAEAMYGCEVMMLKKKYCANKETIHKIELPKEIEDRLINIKRYEQSIRMFFPKNAATTNVERHQWVEAQLPDPWNKQKFGEEMHRRILKAFYPGWDDRYGLYFDDGWIYGYRSGFLLSRFQMKAEENGRYSIVNFQTPSDGNEQLAPLSITEGLYSIEFRWYLCSDEAAPTNLQYCKYYRGQPECPDVFRNTVEGDFWYGEMMFITNKISMEEWKRTASEIKKNLSGRKQEYANKLSPEQFAILIYIETLFSKWRPWDSMEWIYKY